MYKLYLCERCTTICGFNLLKNYYFVCDPMLCNKDILYLNIDMGLYNVKYMIKFIHKIENFVELIYFKQEQGDFILKNYIWGFTNSIKDLWILNEYDKNIFQKEVINFEFNKFILNEDLSYKIDKNEKIVIKIYKENFEIIK